MKSNAFFYLVCLCFTFSLIGCSNDDADLTPNDLEGKVTCKIDGTDFESTIASATIGNGVFSMQGGTNEGQTINITIGTGYNGVGRYSTGGVLSNINHVVTYVPSAVNATQSWSSFGAPENSGELNITSEDGEWVEGTFSIVVFNVDSNATKTLGEGSFRVKIN
ncbi:MAG: DUF6252 family protein [Bacteroidota bacterium]